MRAVDFLPTTLVVIGITYLLSTRSHRAIRFWTRLTSWDKQDTAAEQLVKKQMFYGGIGAIVIGLVAQIYFLATTK